MGTRCNIHFNRGKNLWSNIYVHSDGDPESVLGELLTFFRLLKAEVPDSRLNSPEQLAAKFLVWKSQEMKKYAVRCEFNEEGEYAPVEPTHYLQFLGVSPCLRDHCDIEYVYEVDCDKFDDEGLPIVRWKTAAKGARFKTVKLGRKGTEAA